MIKNVGIDIVKNNRITASPEFVKKLLSPVEYEYYSKISNLNRQIEYLAGRWAAKEAIIKAINHERIVLNEISITLSDNKIIVVDGVPLQRNEQLNVSISHEQEYSVAVAILSENN
ncbi:holo-[acyl-carrier protein] synthase [Spiroplasma syrphidicola EA-1]|uniref:Holo-[acyl-carrier-protein] synthase n=1 Tax=Spiroplasma syrphidicola EA-1 TaxID=1276229 RepID=R4UEB3_9MOLU|nr:4'-phosphopantetheinyl transferase superfamily protein [Spiroplasma syrphidicola]AGM26254.1 holo-[acyl-carrier protein] synthase [Spiroplasma syrphidicola EA-1]